MSVSIPRKDGDLALRGLLVHDAVGGAAPAISSVGLLDGVLGVELVFLAVVHQDQGCLLKLHIAAHAELAVHASVGLVLCQGSDGPVLPLCAAPPTALPHE